VRYTLTYRDEPIGTAELPEGTGMVAGDFTPLPGYALVRAAVRDASEVLFQVGLFGPSRAEPTAADAANAERVARALDRAASLPLALRDPVGAVVPTHFVNVLESPLRPDERTAVVRFGHVPAAVGAALRRPPRQDGDARPLEP